MPDAAISLSGRNSDTKLARQPERLHQLMMCTSVVINRPLLDVINNDHVVVASGVEMDKGGFLAIQF